MSVVIPTYGRPRALARCLASLAEVAPPEGGFEVVVVDDGGRRPARPVVEAAAKAVTDVPTGPPIRLVEQPNRGPAAARNAGAAAARGRFLAFTDDDCRPEPGWLRTLIPALREEPSALVAGPTANALPANPWAAAGQVLIDHLYETQAAPGGPPPFFTSNNLAAARRPFLDLGGFDESFPLAAGEDRELCDRWRREVGPLRFVAAARVGHAHRMGAAGFLRQHFGYGRGAWLFAGRRRQRGDRLARPRLGFYLRLLDRPRRSGHGGWPLAPILLLSQAAHAAGLLWQAVASGLRRPAGRRR